MAAIGAPLERAVTHAHAAVELVDSRLLARFRQCIGNHIADTFICIYKRRHASCGGASGTEKCCQ